MKKTLLTTLAFLPLALLAQRLEVIGSGGQHLSRKGINVTSTIGEVCVAASYGSKHFATEGFQQGFLPPTTVAFRNEDAAAAPTASLFPNPAVDRVQVKLQNMGEQAVWLGLYDKLGKLIQEAETASSAHAFDVSTLPAGNYWISVQSAETLQPLSFPFAKINH